MSSQARKLVDLIDTFGDAEEQLEFLSENGIDAFIERVNQIKSQYPKPGEE